MTLSPRLAAPLLAATLALAQAHAQAQTLTGAAAQKSPQADVLLAYEQALMKGGLAEARAHMTPAKAADLEGMAKAFGDAGFKEFVDRIRVGAQGEARRKQVTKVDVKGDHAVLEARDSPNATTVQHLDKTPQGWKIGVRR